MNAQEIHQKDFVFMLMFLAMPEQQFVKVANRLF
jgi:hypothetical protein